jgi:dihydropteroate synthase
LIELGSKKLDLSEKPLVMGIVNMTPDSFYDGGEYNDPEKALGRIASFIKDGADIIDIGGESTRPGSLGVSAGEELERVIPVIEAAAGEFDTVISVDTTKAVVAEEALRCGALMVNDISGLSFEPQVARKVSEKGAAIILTHTSSRPVDMQEKTDYDSLIPDITDSLLNSVETAMAAGVARENIIIDPGIGFGKTTEQNLEIIRKLEEFCHLGFPVCLGASRKSFIGEILRSPLAEQRLIGSVCSVIISMLKGISIVRVHDVLETVQAIRTVKSIYGGVN